MGQTSRSRTITRDQQSIWDVLSDFGAISSWAGNVDHSSLLGPETGPIGSARRIQMGRDTVVERIVEFDAPRALAYDIEGMPKLVRGLRNRWELHSLPTGFTAVTLTTTVDIGDLSSNDKPTHRVAEWVVGRIAARQSDQLLNGLAAHLEDTHVG